MEYDFDDLYESKPTVEPTVDSVETELVLSGEKKEEARQIPLDKVYPHEAEILKDYLDGCLDENDIPELRLILERYRPYLYKYEPEETMQNYEDNIELVEDEKAFLDLVDTFDEIQVIPFTMYVGDREVRMKFDLYPLSDSQTIRDLAQNLSLFKDFTEDELITYNKVQQGKNLTREELIIKEDLEKRIEKATMENQEKTMIEYLSSQLKFHNKNSSVEDMRKTFQKFNTNYLYLLFNEVQRLNHIGDMNTDKVFQEFD